MFLQTLLQLTEVANGSKYILTVPSVTCARNDRYALFTANSICHGTTHVCTSDLNSKSKGFF